MGKFWPQNLVVITVIASFFAIVVLHIVFMSEMMANSQNCVTGVVQTQDCHQPEGVSCCTIEASVLQTYLQVIPQQLTKILIATVAVGSLLPLLLILLYENSLFVVFRSWINRARERILAFHHQIGSWLATLEKRDPAHNPLWCGFKFAMIPIT